MSTFKNENVTRLTVNEKESIEIAMRAIDNGALGIAFIIDDNGKFVGLVTDGDVRRAILQGVQIESPIRQIMETSPIVIQGKLTEEKLLELQNSEAVKSRPGVGYTLKIPVLDSESKIRDIMLFPPEGKNISMLSEHGSRDWRPVKKVLVIGNAGYSGTILTRKLLSRGYLVNGLDNLLYGDHGLRELYGKEGFNFIEGDIRDIKVLMEATEGCDAAILLAAIVGDPSCELDPEETISINYLATKMVAEVCKYCQINRMIFVSTCSVYGASEKPGALLNENSLLSPVSLYAEMKLKSEKSIIEAMDDNFSPTIFRPGTLYGLSPRMRFDLVLNILTAKATIDGEITIFGGNQWRPLLHVEDVVEAYIKCLEAPIEKVRGQYFNVGANQQNYKISELANILKEVFPDLKINYREDAVDERNYSVDFNKIGKVLDYRAEKTVQDGIREIKQALETGIIGDYTDKIHSNYESLSEQFNTFNV
ncbi:NAD-dependent epimerase/dehydratase family protein [Chloroflexota bacterium]